MIVSYEMPTISYGNLIVTYQIFVISYETNKISYVRADSSYESGLTSHNKGPVFGHVRIDEYHNKVRHAPKGCDGEFLRRPERPKLTSIAQSICLSLL